MTIFPFLFCWWKRSRVSKACNRGASRLGEAWPRPRLGRKTHWHKDKARLTGTRNYIILLLKSQQGLEGLKPMEIEAKQYDKEGTLFWSSKRKKSRRAKMGLPSSSFDSQLLLVKSASTWNKRFNRFAAMKGPKLDPPGGTTFDFNGVHFPTPF